MAPMNLNESTEDLIQKCITKINRVLTSHADLRQDRSLNLFITFFGSNHQNFADKLADRTLRDGKIMNIVDQNPKSCKNDPLDCLYYLPEDDIPEMNELGLCLPYGVIQGNSAVGRTNGWSR